MKFILESLKSTYKNVNISPPEAFSNAEDSRQFQTGEQKFCIPVVL
jgi:hypothetical protein